MDTKHSYAYEKIEYNFNDLIYNPNLHSASKTSDILERKIEIGLPDVDVDIPIINFIQEHSYALIIGNEDYKSKQKDLNYEQNADFAVNDASVFSTYCEKLLGIPVKQIKYLKNATAAEINQGIAWLKNLIKIENGNSKVIFYYSGHGLPNDQTREPYLIPVDVSGSNLSFAIKLSNIYNELTEFPSKQIIVFFDACFSGGARNQGLVAMKGVKIKPNENILNGNLVVVSSSSGDENSAVYKEKKHGYFTYFLLKKLKESKGDITLEDLSIYLVSQVRKEVGLVGIIQTPQINVSAQAENFYRLWKL
jgi:hypothetical protein